MKVLVLLCLAAMALADDKASYGKQGYDNDGYDGYNDGYHGGYNYAHAANRAREAKVNYYNAGRQHAVNAAAEYKGAGTGTAEKYGVPGVNSGATYNGYGYGGYGYGNGYGNGYGYANRGHGYDNRGYGYNDGKY